MTASSLVSQAISPLKCSDSVHEALLWLNDFKVQHLPVVSEGRFIGVVTEDSLIEISDKNALLRDFSIFHKDWCVKEDVHFFEVLKLANEYKLSLIPVVSLQGMYLGYITLTSILEKCAEIIGINESGGVIVIEMQEHNHSLAYIAQIIEAEQAKILSSYVQDFKDSTRVRVTIKINRTDLTTIVAGLERYNYQIVEIYNSSNDSGDSNDRYDSLMNYLNV